MRKLTRKSDYHKNRNTQNVLHKLSYWIKFRILMSGGVKGIIGWAFFLMGALITTVFASLTDWSTLFSFSDDDPITTGIVETTRFTNSSVNDLPVIAVHFAYKLPSGEAHTAVSYSEGEIYKENEEVEIQYVASEPHLAKIVGLRAGEFGFWPMFITLPFSVIGLIFIIITFKSGKQSIRILENGKIGYATFIGKEATGSRVNNQIVYRMFFEFSDENEKIFQVSAATHSIRKLMDESFEKVIYLPKNPSEAVLLDGLPALVKKHFRKLYPAEFN